METLTAPIQMFDMREPIPGYVLRERIGAGGYGEVWRAEAPGGLQKAVKIVFGPLNAQRADREMKALSRIKQVQHPLLLSLERIEIVDQHLIIVSELAHGSLRERFDTHVAAGQPGIPRDELLAYLKDVADALDYLYEKHSLQHLDVKPENLLLIADRVKVADFGLVKDLHDTSESLVGGLTPLYAPPEVFDGRPNRNSDQYSLAIVYQELLTGEPPFAGRTVAQLAAQHLHSTPCLAALPPPDQPIIGRALSKDPARRYANCRALVDALHEAPRTAARSRRSVGTNVQRAPLSSDTTGTGGQGTKQFKVSSTVEALPPLTLDPAVTAYRPTIFVGIGGSGVHVLRQLRRRLRERFDSIDDVPSLQMLLLDTDARGLLGLTRGSPGQGFRSNQILPLPLRQPQEYRRETSSILEWLNRRWLYNIPKSLQTEGIRPLGRLAFVDHFEAISEALQHAIGSATSAEAIQVSAQRTGLQFAAVPPRIFVIAAPGGGAGGGMALDMGYAIRTVLSNLGLSDEQLLGMLVHSTPRRSSVRDLTNANLVSLLNELQHYASSKGYPGEPACNLPAFPGGCGPFEHTYLLHLGDELADEDYEAGVSAVAEYLFQNSVSRAAGFFERSRIEDASERDEQGQVLRTCYVSRIGGTANESAIGEAGRICVELLEQWLGRGRGTAAAPQASALDPGLEGLARKLAQGLDINLERLFGWADELLKRSLREEPTTCFQRMIAEALPSGAAPTRGDARQALPAGVASVVRDRIDRLFMASTGHADCLELSIEKKVRSAGQTKAETLRDWFQMLLDSPKTRSDGARKAIAWFQELLNQLEQELAQIEQHLAEDTVLLRSANSEAAVLDYGVKQYRLLIHRTSRLMVRLLKAETARCGDLFGELSVRLRQLSSEFTSLASQHEGDQEAPSSLARFLAELRPDHLQRVDRELSLALARKQLTLSALASGNADMWTQFVGALRATAERLVTSAVSRIQVLAAIDPKARQALDDLPLPDDCARAALPRLLECGGAKRALLVTPNKADHWPETWSGPFSEALGVTPNVVRDTEDAITVCCEVSDVPMSNVIVSLSGERPDCLQAAGRLHTRIDVDWPTIS